MVLRQLSTGLVVITDNFISELFGVQMHGQGTLELSQLTLVWHLYQTLYILIFKFSQQYYEVDDMIIPTLQMEKPS